MTRYFTYPELKGTLGIPFRGSTYWAIRPYISPLISEQFWTVIYSPAILKFVLELQRVTEQCKSNSELYHSRSPVGRQMSQGEKNVQPDRDSNPGPSEYRSAALPTDTFSPLISEQFWTVTDLCCFCSFFSSEWALFWPRNLRIRT
jgi:hypothetical protein